MEGHLQINSVVTHSQAVFWVVIDCDPGCSFEYSAYWSNYPLYCRSQTRLHNTGTDQPTSWTRHHTCCTL